MLTSLADIRGLGMNYEKEIRLKSLGVKTQGLRILYGMRDSRTAKWDYNRRGGYRTEMYGGLRGKTYKKISNCTSTDKDGGKTERQRKRVQKIRTGIILRK